MWDESRMSMESCTNSQCRPALDNSHRFFPRQSLRLSSSDLVFHFPWASLKHFSLFSFCKLKLISDGAEIWLCVATVLESVFLSSDRCLAHSQWLVTFFTIFRYSFYATWGRFTLKRLSSRRFFHFADQKKKGKSHEAKVKIRTDMLRVCRMIGRK